MPPQADLSNPISTYGDGQQSFSDDEVDSDPPDLPPESFWVSKEYELDWLDRNSFVQRKGSTKVIFSGNLNFTPNRNSYSSSQFSMNSKSRTSIIGLPTSQISCFADGILQRSCKPGNVPLLRCRSKPGERPFVQVSQPGSPKVSCMEKVRSRKGIGRRTRVWAKFKAVFRTGLKASRVGNKESAEFIEPEVC
ncbi:hypothetical protein F0562_025819 [Nyssa sinensis]|uniref:Uncharacterized protein n=1 Tax=Nyssa sinensis TaxID=561372 RepID=A0A5J5BBJ4_9ASTE|nr:hypothetical protein F0562_025819 [Nyssa sinensis]